MLEVESTNLRSEYSDFRFLLEIILFFKTDWVNNNFSCWTISTRDEPSMANGFFLRKWDALFFQVDCSAMSLHLLRVYLASTGIYTCTYSHILR